MREIYQNWLQKSTSAGCISKVIAPGATKENTLTLRELKKLEEAVLSKNVHRGGGIWLGQKAALLNCEKIKIGKMLLGFCFCFLPLCVGPTVPESTPTVTQISDEDFLWGKITATQTPWVHEELRKAGMWGLTCLGQMHRHLSPIHLQGWRTRGRRHSSCFFSFSLLGWGWSSDLRNC